MQSIWHLCLPPPLFASCICKSSLPVPDCNISTLCVSSPCSRAPFPGKNSGEEPIRDHRIRNMESLVKQKRLSFSGSGQHSREALQGDRERTRDKVPNWFWRQFSPKMSGDYDSDDDKFAAALAAAAFAIYSLEEPDLEKRTREPLESSKSRLKSKKEDPTGFFGKEAQNPGQTSVRKPLVNDGTSLERALPFPRSRPSNVSVVRSASAAPREQTQQGYSTWNMNVQNKVDAWEKAQMSKIKKRYDNINSRILSWENEKKMKAKLVIERKKSELEQRRSLNLQHYQIKIERIEQIAGGARQQIKEKRRHKESEVKDKAEMIKKTGNVPVSCFCF